MKNLEKRMRDLEELIFKVVLETKAETMAIRDILMERDLVSRERWDKLVNGHKTSYSYFEIVRDIEKRRNAKSSEVHRDQGAGIRRSPCDSSQGPGNMGPEK